MDPSMTSNTALCSSFRELPRRPLILPALIADPDCETKFLPYACLAESGQGSDSASSGAGRRPCGWRRRELAAGVKPAKSKVPSCMWVTGIPSGRSSAVRTSVKAESAEQTVASGAWNGGLMEEMMDGVRTRTLGLGRSLSPGGLSRAVRRGKKAWMVRIG
jgi:hypothetical protein